jgi:hypothetical protein
VLGTVHWTIEPEKLKFQILVVWAWRVDVPLKAAKQPASASNGLRMVFFMSMGLS